MRTNINKCWSYRLSLLLFLFLFSMYPPQRCGCCLLSTVWKSFYFSPSFKNDRGPWRVRRSLFPGSRLQRLLLLCHGRHYSLIHTTGLRHQLNHNAPARISLRSSTEFINPPAPAAVSPPEVGALGGGEAWERCGESSGTDAQEGCSPSVLGRFL